MKTRTRGRAWARRRRNSDSPYLWASTALKTRKGARVYHSSEMRIFIGEVEIKGFADGYFHRIFEDGTEVVEK